MKLIIGEDIRTPMLLPQAWRYLGISRSTWYRLLKKYPIPVYQIGRQKILDAADFAAFKDAPFMRKRRRHAAQKIP